MQGGENPTLKTPAGTIEFEGRNVDDDGMESFLGWTLERLLDPTLLASAALLSLALLSGLVGRIAQFGDDVRHDRWPDRHRQSAEPTTTEVSR